jgi:hypothetical protein
VWFIRHYEKKKPWTSRPSKAAAQLRKDRREHRLAREAMGKEDATGVQYLTYRQYMREAATFVAHMTGFVQDEIDLKKNRGFGELATERWLEVRELVDPIQSELDELKLALGILIDDQGDWLEGEVVDDDYGIEDAEVLELDAPEE